MCDLGYAGTTCLNSWNTNNSKTAASMAGYSCISSVTPGESRYSTTAITLRPVPAQFTNHLIILPQYAPLAGWLCSNRSDTTQKRSQNGRNWGRSASDPAASQLQHRSAARSMTQEDGSHFRRLSKLAQSNLLASSRVCPSAWKKKIGSHWTDYHEILYTGIFWRYFGEIQVPLKSDTNKGYFT